jgi:hypothetical protein
MKLVADTTDLSNAVEVFCSGVAGITELGPGVLRVTYYGVREDGDGRRENHIVDHQIWSMPQLMDNLLVMQRVLMELGRAEVKPRLALVEGMH